MGYKERRGANIELLSVWDTSCLAELIYDIIRPNSEFLCGKCPKPVTIQYLLPGRNVKRREIKSVDMFTLFLLESCAAMLTGCGRYGTVGV